MRKRTLTLTLILVAFLLAGVGLTIYRIYAVRVIYVPGGAMMNTVVPGDRILARRFSGEVQRGEIIVYQYPGDATYYLGRVIGLPNEKIDVRDKFVHINDRLLDEERGMVEPEDFETNELQEISVEGKGSYRVYYTAGQIAEQTRLNGTRDDPGPYRMAADSFFVMGDNRDNSEDSRYRGSVPRELIWGKMFMIYFSSTVDSGEVRWHRTFKRVR